MPNTTAVDIALFIIVLMAIVGPFVVKKIENNLEAFLLIMGILAVTISGFESTAVLEEMGYDEERISNVRWSGTLIEEAIIEPILKGIVPLLLFVGIIFHFGRRVAQDILAAVFKIIPPSVVVFLMIAGLGLAPARITDIWPAVLMAELVSCMPLDRQTKVNIAILACFSIGLGAILTPLGGTLPIVAMVKLMGPPYYASSSFLFNQLAIYVIPGVLAMGLLGAFFTGRKTSEVHMVATEDAGSMRDVIVRVAKVYVFLMALFLLNDGMNTVIFKYLPTVPSQILYWVNMISAILENAMLGAAELSPSLDITHIRALLMSLIVSGGMLIPGNIPNIISAGRLGITSKEWAKLGVPLGIVLMALYFVWIFYIPFHIDFGL